MYHTGIHPEKLINLDLPQHEPDIAWIQLGRSITANAS